MNRPSSEQLDTLEQRARAFGYRGDLLPYCQFFATPRTLKVLREIVDTEYDIRAQLQDWLNAGQSVTDWAAHIGLAAPGRHPADPPSGADRDGEVQRPPGLAPAAAPVRIPADMSDNQRLVEASGSLEAPARDYGRLSHPTLMLPLGQVVDALLGPWSGVRSEPAQGGDTTTSSTSSPGCRRPTTRCPVMLLRASRWRSARA